MFELISEAVGIPLDKAKYVALFFLSFPLAIILRSVLHYSYTSSTIRHCYSIIFGVLFGWICFDWKVLFLVAFLLVGYLLLILFPPQVVGRYSMVYTLLCVLVGHWYRMMTDYGGFTLDFTGPLMVMVQRVTYVAYAYYDGAGRDEKELNEDQKRLSISAPPSLLEYFSYNFNFMTVMAGPTAPYKEYDNFITGKQFTDTKQVIKTEPNPFWPMIKKFTLAVFFLALYSYLMRYETVSLITDPSYTLPRRILNVTFIAFIFRCRYYFTFLIVEAISNAGGFGFNGYTEDGKEKWNLVQMLDLTQTEIVSSARGVMTSWNKTTHAWLKGVIYERNDSSVLKTNIVGALWHGLYPGYFFAYVVAFFSIYSGRKWHHLNVLSTYSSTHPIKILYNIISIILLSAVRDFLFVTFWLLLLDDIFAFWRFYYFIPLIVMGLMIIILPTKKRTKTKEN